MNQNLIAKSSITIDASPTKVWNALVTPEAIKQYMFGTTVVSDWKEGSKIIWKGEWQGKLYVEKGAEQAREHSERNWALMLATLKQYLEN